MEVKCDKCGEIKEIDLSENRESDMTDKAHTSFDAYVDEECIKCSNRIEGEISYWEDDISGDIIEIDDSSLNGAKKV